MSQSEDNRLHRRLALNTISNLARFGLLMVITFFLTPFIVKTMGSSTYTAMIVGSLISLLVHVGLCMRVALSGEGRRVALGKVFNFLPGQ